MEEKRIKEENRRKYIQERQKILETFAKRVAKRKEATTISGQTRIEQKEE